MTVKELIEKLKEYPQDTEVWVSDGYGNPEPAKALIASTKQELDSNKDNTEVVFLSDRDTIFYE